MPLASLLKIESESEKSEIPIIRYGEAFQAKKGEDFTMVKMDCQRILGDRSSTFAVFGVCMLYALSNYIFTAQFSHLKSV